MPQIITLLVLAVLVSLCFLLVFWQFSNIRSMILGAPAISSPNHRLWQAIASPDQVWLDLGCGNASFCLMVAPYVKHVYGIEFSPFYYFVSRLRTSGRANITIIYANFLKDPWPKSDIIYCYLLPELLTKLRPKLQRQSAVVASYAFPVEGWQPSRLIEEGRRRLYLYGDLARLGKRADAR